MLEFNTAYSGANVTLILNAIDHISGVSSVLIFSTCQEPLLVNATK
jgi:hypothetical protein